MKKLIFPLLLAPFISQAAEIKEISDKQITSKFLTIVKDAEVEKLLGGSAEFANCKKQYEIKPTDQPAVKSQKLKDATACFKQKLTGKNADALKKLANDLKLEDHGLIKSKNVTEITTYLSSKMTKALTGRDPNEKDPKKILESLKWENQKIVDQKVFIDLYTNQLMKNALFEVSRFCFENLRVMNNGKNNFAEQWAAMKKIVVDDPAGGQMLDVKKITDDGDPSYLDLSQVKDINDKEEVYNNMVKGLSSNTANPLNAADFGEFFPFCQKAITQLCDVFKTDAKVTNSAKDDFNSVNSVVDASGNVAQKQPLMSRGANACLAKERLQNLRIAMKNTEKVAKQFEEMGNEKDAFAIEMISNPKIYQRGKGEGEDSLDEISSFSSTEMLESEQKNKLGDLEQQCQQGGSSECDDFLVTGDSLDKAIINVETNMNLKREIEVARVNDLKTKPEELKKYLEENGHFDLLEKIKNPPPGFDIEKEIGLIYDARKVAEIEHLKLKVGRRQISEDDSKKITDAGKQQLIQSNIKDTKEERARMAQVVLFNNIITSQLTLTDKDSNKEVGRNVSGWNKEYKGLQGSGIQTDVFQGIQQVAEKEGNKMEDTSVVGGGIIDMILGSKETQKKGP